MKHHLQRNNVMEKPNAKEGGSNTSYGGWNHVRNWGCHFDGKQTCNSHEEAKCSLRRWVHKCLNWKYKKRKPTVIRDPHINVVRVSELPEKSSTTPGTSPASTTTPERMTEDKRLVYQHKSRAESPSSLIAFLITTACRAVVALLTTPKNTPFIETLTPSKKTPTKKPRVTIAHAKNMETDGRAERKT